MSLKMIDKGKLTFVDSFPYKLDTSTIKTLADVVNLLGAMDIGMTKEEYEKRPNVQKYFKLKE